MAQGCIYFDIQEWICGRWVSVIQKPFRDTRAGAETRYRRHETRNSSRLVEVKTLLQDNRP